MLGTGKESMWVCGCVGVWVCGCVGVWGGMRNAEKLKN
jgi:hypothetical protein